MRVSFRANNINSPHCVQKRVTREKVRAGRNEQYQQAVVAGAPRGVSVR